MKENNYPNTNYNLQITTVLKFEMGKLLEHIDNNIDSAIWEFVYEEYDIDLKDMDTLKMIVLQKLLDMYKKN